ncbi:hypothetical protein C0J52_12120 [Blattella germanica]|nr:hypothetical protein C0J52_12120 [Blattella germanica]
MSTFSATPNNLKTFIEVCLKKVGVPDENAAITADALVYFETVGLAYKGINELGLIIEEIKKGIIDPRARPMTMKESDTCIWVNGRNSIGHVVGKYCMKKAIDKATRYGLCIVSATGSNSYGSGSWYVEQASNSGLLGFSFTNSECDIIPPNGTKCATGSNPITFSTPGVQENILLDMGLCTTALGKLMFYKEEMNPYWTLDANRKPAEDWQSAVYALPLGAAQKSSVKGFGLSLMVDILCGLLGGSDFGPYLYRRETRKTPPNIGHCFLVLNPGCFAPGFESRQSNFLRKLRNLPPLEAENPVKIPGDGKRISKQKIMNNGEITLSIEQVKLANSLADKLGVKLLQVRTLD